MPVQPSFVRSIRVSVLAAVLLLVSTGIAGVPIRVSWHPTPVIGNLPTSLAVELDQPAEGFQPVAVTYDNPGYLNAAPTTGMFVAGQSVLVLAVNTNPTTTEKHVFATVSTGGGSLKSDELVILPTTIIDGFVGGSQKSAAAMGAAQGDQAPVKAPKVGVPIAVSFLDDSDAMAISEVKSGKTSALYIQLPQKAEANRSVILKFVEGLDLISEPNVESMEVPITKDRRGVSVQVVTKPGAQGTIKVKVTSGNYSDGTDELKVKK